MNKMLILLLLCSLAITVSANPIFPIKPKKARPDSTVTLRVLTWNIQMLPRFISDKAQKTRTKWIIEDLMKQDVDVIVFEEVFDVGIRGILRLALLPKYPFQIGVQNKRWTWKQSNGVWVISRLPIKKLKHVFFKDSYGTDGLANKGAVLVEGTKQGKKFQIVATHLQSMNEPAAARVRENQLAQIRAELLDPFAKDEVPQMLIGDLNTPKHTELAYQNMLQTTGMKDCALSDERPYTWDLKNSWNEEYAKEEQSSQLDYILLNARHSLTAVRRLLIHRPFQLFNQKKTDLADHYGIMGEIDLQ